MIIYAVMAADGSVDVSDAIIGIKGDNNKTIIAVKVYAAIAAYTGKIRFTLPSGATYDTAAVGLYGQAVAFPVPYQAIREAGQIKCNLIAVSGATTVTSDAWYMQVLAGDVPEVVPSDKATAGIEDQGVLTAMLKDLNVTKGKLSSAVQASLDLADTSIQRDALATAIRMKKVTLNAGAVTPVAFKTATAGSVTGTETGTAGVFDLSGVGDGGTIKATPDGGAEQTATINAAAGASTSASSPSTNISGGSDTSFKIRVNGDTVETVALTLTGLTSGAAIATEMQTKIRAKGGQKANVTVAYSGGKYVITSARLGTSSAVVITNADANNVADDLKIGVANGGVEAAGTGDVANLAAATLAEIIAVIATDMTGITGSNSTNHLKLTSGTTGKNSKVVIGSGTLHTALGLTGTGYGAQGMGYSTDMSNATYLVFAMLNGASSLAGKGVSVNSRAASGFNLLCETTAAADDVDLLVLGIPAAS